MCRHVYFYATCLVLVIQIQGQDFKSYFENIKHCLTGNESIICVKEEILDILNGTIYNDEPILFGSINITRDKDHTSEFMRESLPMEASQRSMMLTNNIYSKIEEFFNSRIIQFRTGDSVEARKKGGGVFGGGGGGGGGKKGGGGGLMILLGVAMAGMLAQVFMGKIALVAGAALLIAKMALMFTLFSSFKKSSGDGGGKESAHVVYASGGSDTYSHGHGGWHRSLTREEDAQTVAYSAYLQQNPYP